MEEFSRGIIRLTYFDGPIEPMPGSTLYIQIQEEVGAGVIQVPATAYDPRSYNSVPLDSDRPSIRSGYSYSQGTTNDTQTMMEASSARIHTHRGHNDNHAELTEIAEQIQQGRQNTYASQQVWNASEIACAGSNRAQYRVDTPEPNQHARGSHIGIVMDTIDEED